METWCKTSKIYFKIPVFWDMMLCQTVNNYCHCKEDAYLHFQGQRNDPEDGGSKLKLPCNPDNYVLPENTLLYPTGLQSSKTLLWETQI